MKRLHFSGLASAAAEFCTVAASVLIARLLTQRMVEVRGKVRRIRPTAGVTRAALDLNVVPFGPEILLRENDTCRAGGHVCWVQIASHPANGRYAPVATRGDRTCDRAKWPER